MFPLRATNVPTTSQNSLLTERHHVFAMQFQKFLELFSALTNSPQQFLQSSSIDRTMQPRLQMMYVGTRNFNEQLFEHIPPRSFLPVFTTKTEAKQETKEEISITISMGKFELQDIEKPRPDMSQKSRMKYLSVPLANTSRVCFCTAAGRTSSWLIKTAMPTNFGAATTPLIVGSTLLRLTSAYGLIHFASRSAKNRKTRLCVRASGLFCGMAMLTPLYFLKEYAPQLKHQFLLDNLADIGYVAVRDPAQSALRNFGNRVSLKSPNTKGSPHLPAFFPLSVAYGFGAALWCLLFKESIGPAALSLGPIARSAINTIGPAAVIEGTEAGTSAIIFSTFPGAIYAHDNSLEKPELRVCLITAAMRYFATGVFQICNLIAQLCFGMPDGMPWYVIGVVMFFLEWLGAVSQQAIVNMAATPASIENGFLAQLNGKNA